MATDLDERIQLVEVSKEENASCKDPPTVGVGGGGDCNGVSVGIAHDDDHDHDDTIKDEGGIDGDVKDDGDGYVFVDGAVSDDPLDKDLVTEFGQDHVLPKTATSLVDKEHTQIHQSSSVVVEGGKLEKEGEKSELDSPLITSVEAAVESELCAPEQIVVEEEGNTQQEEADVIVAEVAESTAQKVDDGEKEKVQEETQSTAVTDVGDSLNCAEIEVPHVVVTVPQQMDDEGTRELVIGEELEEISQSSLSHHVEEKAQEISKVDVVEESGVIQDSPSNQVVNEEEKVEETSKGEVAEESDHNSLPQVDNGEEKVEETSKVEAAEESEIDQNSLPQVDNGEEKAEESSNVEAAGEAEVNQNSPLEKAEEKNIVEVAEESDVYQNSPPEKVEETSTVEIAEESQVNQNSPPEKVEETSTVEVAEESDVNQNSPLEKVEEASTIVVAKESEVSQTSPPEKVEETSTIEVAEESEVSQTSPPEKVEETSTIEFAEESEVTETSLPEKVEETTTIDIAEESQVNQNFLPQQLDNGEKVEETSRTEAAEELQMNRNPPHQLDNGDEKAEETHGIDAAEGSKINQSSPPHQLDNGEEQAEEAADKQLEFHQTSPPHQFDNGEEQADKAVDEQSELNQTSPPHKLHIEEEKADDLTKVEEVEESDVSQNSPPHQLENGKEKAEETGKLESAEDIETNKNSQFTARKESNSESFQLSNEEKSKLDSSAKEEVHEDSQITATEHVETELEQLDHGEEQEAVTLANELSVEEYSENRETEQKLEETATHPSDDKQLEVEGIIGTSESIESLPTRPDEQTVSKTEVENALESSESKSCTITEVESESHNINGSVENFKSLAHSADHVNSEIEVETTLVENGETLLVGTADCKGLDSEARTVSAECRNMLTSSNDHVESEDRDIKGSIEREHNLSVIPGDEADVEPEIPNSCSNLDAEPVDAMQSDIPIQDVQIESEAPNSYSNLADVPVDDAQLESECGPSSAPSKEEISGSGVVKEVVEIDSRDKSVNYDDSGVPICKEVVSNEWIESNGNPPASAEESATVALEGQKVEDEVVRKPFHFLIRIPRFVDDNIRDQIGLAQQQVDEKTQSRDAIRSTLQSRRAICSEYRDKFEAAKSEERAAREVVNAKRKEMDSIQSVINRMKNENSIDDIDDRVHNMEHRIQHETMPLKEEKQLIREMKQLKQLREQICSSLGREAEAQQTSDERDGVEERFKLLKQEMESARKEVMRTEGMTKATRKQYLDENEKLRKLQDEFKAADDLRQEAYVQLQNLKKQLYQKNKYFRMYKEDVQRAEDFKFARDNEALQRLCDNQVEMVMELWNKNDEFRNDYIRCNKMSTLRRLRTLDGRSLGPDEEPPLLRRAVDERVNSNIGSSSDKITSSVPLLTPEQGKSVVLDAKPGGGFEQEYPKLNVKPVINLEQKNPTPISKKEIKPAVLDNGSATATVSGQEAAEENNLTKEEEELARKAEELRKEESAAKLKEQRRLEEKAKAKEAEERKRRNAEKAQARAQLRAQKEAELKEKEREKRARKKEKKKAAAAGASGGVETESASVSEVNLPETTRELEIKEKPETVAKRPQKPSVLAKQSKTKTIPPPLRNRGKRRMQQWMWIALAIVVVLALFLLGNIGYSFKLGLPSFGF